MKMSFKDYTVPITDGCMYCSRQEVIKAFRGFEVEGRVSLCHVIDESRSVNTMMWFCIDGSKVNFLPLFTDDAFIKSLHNITITPMYKDAILLSKSGERQGVCYFYIKEEETVRQIKIFPDENMVEKFFNLKGYRTLAVLLVRVFLAPESKYVTTCWSVYYEDPDELDDEGEPQKYLNLLPVDLADFDIIREYGPARLHPVMLEEGETFVVQGEAYRVLKDGKKKLFITKDIFTKPNQKPMMKVLGAKEEKNEPKSKCRVIKLKKC
jgi:hypothetical protein